MKKLRFTILAFSIFSISACATLTDDIDIETLAAADVDYDLYKTFAWAENAQIKFDPVGQWEQPTLDTDEEVKYFISRELRGHGLHPLTEKADLRVVFSAGIDATSLNLKEDPNNTRPVITDVPKSALLIALIDNKTDYTVWFGFALVDPQQQHAIENIHKRIEYAINEILDDY